MLSRFTKLRLADLLYNIAEGEKKIEAVRQVLAEKLDFEPYVTFKRMAVAPTPYLSSNDIYEFLLENNINITPDDATLLLKLFDTNKDDRLSFSEFLNAVLPKENSELRQQVTMRPTYDIREGERLPYDIEYGLARILEEELKIYNRVENLKQEVSLCYDFTAINAFKMLDCQGKDYLSPEDIIAFVEDNGVYLEDKEFKSLFRKLDQDLDGKIIYSEFLESLFSAPLVDFSVSEKESLPSKSLTSPARASKTSQVIGKLVSSPPTKEANFEADYGDYLIESKIRSSSPKREIQLQDKGVYETPERSAIKIGSKEFSSRKKSPMKGNEEEELVRGLKEIINNTKLLENTKNELTLRSDFNLFDAFKLFDTEGRAQISFQEFEDGLADLNISISKDGLMLLFRRFDTDYDNLLRFTDFHEIISPRSPEYTKIMINRKPKNVIDQEEAFSAGTKTLFAKVLELAINNEIEAESIKRRLARRSLFNLHDAFRAIDKQDQGFITMEDFQEILDDYGIFMSYKELNLLVERFKSDEAQNNGKISYTDFIKELSPKTFKNSEVLY